MSRAPLQLFALFFALLVADPVSAFYCAPGGGPLVNLAPSGSAPAATIDEDLGTVWFASPPATLTWTGASDVSIGRVRLIGDFRLVTVELLDAFDVVLTSGSAFHSAFDEVIFDANDTAARKVRVSLEAQGPFPVVVAELYVETLGASSPPLAAAGPGGEEMTASATFQGVGDGPGGGFSSKALGVSPDGRAVVGETEVATAAVEAFRFVDGALELLGVSAEIRYPDFATAFTECRSALESRVFAASNLGLEVVGEACDSTTCAPIRFEGGSPIVLQQPKGAFFWRRGRATDVTPDGASTFGEYEVLISTLDPAASVFRADAGGITTLASGLFATIVSPVRVTPDAACVVWTWNGMFGGVSSSIGSCGALPADRVEDVAADNAVGVGQIGLVAAQGSTTLGDLVGGSEESRALGVSDDGGIIVGWGTSASGREAVVWRDGGPIELLADVLTAEGVDVSNWTLEEATGVSASGRTIVGWGTNPNGDTEGFVATLGDGPAPTPPVPTLSPAGLLVFAAGLLGFIGYYRRRF